MCCICQKEGFNLQLCSICNRYYHSNCILCEGEEYDVKNKDKWKCFLCEPIYYTYIKRILKDYIQIQEILDSTIEINNYESSTNSSISDTSSDDELLKKECMNEKQINQIIENEPIVSSYKIWMGKEYSKASVPIDILPEEMLIYFEDEDNEKMKKLVDKYKNCINRIEYQQFYNMSQSGVNLIKSIKKEKEYYRHSFMKKKLFFNTAFPIPQELLTLKKSVYIFIYINIKLESRLLYSFLCCTTILI